MRISVVRPGELGPDDIAAWRNMQVQTRSLANPFLSPEFAVAVGQVREHTRVAVLSDGSDTVGFFPFERGRYGIGLPLGPAASDYQGLVHAPGLEWDPRELLRACKLDIWRFDHLEANQKPFEPYRTAILPSPLIDLTEGFASYYGKLRARSPQFCKDIERKTRKLEREAGPLRFEVNSDDEAAFRSLLSWKSQQYQRTGQADILNWPWYGALVDALFAGRGGSNFSGLFSVLYAADVPVAAHFGLRGNGILGHWHPAYDIKFAKYSAGLIMHLRLAEFTCEVGVREIDLAVGAHRYKEELKSRDNFVGYGCVTAGTARGTVLAAAQRTRESSSRWLTASVQQNPALLKRVRWIRRQRRFIPGLR